MLSSLPIPALFLSFIYNIATGPSLLEMKLFSATFSLGKSIQLIQARTERILHKNNFRALAGILKEISVHIDTGIQDKRTHILTRNYKLTISET